MWLINSCGNWIGLFSSIQPLFIAYFRLKWTDLCNLRWEWSLSIQTSALYQSAELGNNDFAIVIHIQMSAEKLSHCSKNERFRHSVSITLSSFQNNIRFYWIAFASSFHNMFTYNKKKLYFYFGKSFDSCKSFDSWFISIFLTTNYLRF